MSDLLLDFGVQCHCADLYSLSYHCGVPEHKRLLNTCRVPYHMALDSFTGMNLEYLKKVYGVGKICYSGEEREVCS